MKNAVRMIAAAAVLLLASEIFAQAAAPPFALKLGVTPGSAKAGANILRRLILQIIRMSG